MAWNQPGDNGNRDPWGNRGGQQGPPDLDEVLRKLQAQWNKYFGKRPPSAGGSGGGIPGGGPIGLGLIAAVLLVAWWVAGINIIQEPEQGVVLRFGKYHRTMDPGFNWAPYFIDSVETVNVDEVRSAEIGFRKQGGSVGNIDRESLMLTEDENIVDLQFAVQYRVSSPGEFLFEVSEPEMTLRQATESAVREIVGRNGMDYVITTGREAVATEARLLIQDILNRYKAGLRILSVNSQNAQPPAEVQDAFLDAIKAREDQERIINEAKAYQADVVPKARGEATAIFERAKAYEQRVVAQADGETARFLNVLAEYQKAPDVTRERMYIEAVESVMANSSKVLVDVPNGNNLIYLPLDKLIGAGANDADGERRGGFTSSTAQPSASGGFGDGRRSRDNRSGRTR